MFYKTSEEFKEFFLLEFTKQLIRNSIDIEMQKLAYMVKQQEEKEINLINEELKEKKNQVIKDKKEIKRYVKEKIKKKEEYFSSIKKGPEREGSPFMVLSQKGLINRNVPFKNKSFIQEHSLPEKIQSLKPIPMPGEIDLGKINNFIQDPVIRTIECNGPEQNIIISGIHGAKETNISLTKEEIEDIIKKFSKETKIPLQEGLFKVAYGKFIISAIYSESIGSKFIIRKMISQNRPKFVMNR